MLDSWRRRFDWVHVSMDGFGRLGRHQRFQFGVWFLVGFISGWSGIRNVMVAAFVFMRR